MNIDSIGPETIDDYFSRGIIKDASDLYHIRVQDISGSYGTRVKSATRIVENIKASLAVPFERVVYAIGIRFVGETIAKILAKKFKTIDALAAATFEELTEVDGIGDAIANSVIAYFSDQRNIEFVERLRSAGVAMSVSEDKMSDAGSNVLEGQSIVISGVFSHHSRDEYKELIELHGGKNVSSISSKTSFILAGENMGPSKLQKAEKLGVRIINEEEFLQIINNK
jgi:DNA ligase (NAD+)